MKNKKQPWEEFFDSLTFEFLMGATPLLLLKLFYEWLENNRYIQKSSLDK